ncbi:MAG: hypothetical protein NWE91_00175 [Candidatus Bathyarchaeota archaeon]|nr:hypothetical protein [Candidatus Bathyarchaeota archaeon]
MKINLLNPMILAENYEELAEWYEKTFDLAIKTRVEEGEEYMELGAPSKILFGFARAKEMGVKPSTPRNNTVIIQLSVNDINELFDKVKKAGGKILFGPSIDEEEGYLYGGLADIEGNQIWVIEKRGD